MYITFYKISLNKKHKDMKILRNIVSSVVRVLFTSADPNLFGIGGFVGDLLDGGEAKRDKAAKKLSAKQRGYAKESQLAIDAARSRNPFETAAAKSAMATASRKAKQMEQRYANMLGGNASPEAIIAAQGATQGAIAGAAGTISSGAENIKENEIARLRSEKQRYRGSASSTEQGRIGNIGSGWQHFFENIKPLMGQSMEAGGALLKDGGAASAGGAAGGAGGAAAS